LAILGGLLATRIGRRLDEGGLVPFAALSAATAISLAFLASDRVSREPARAAADPGAPDILLVTLDTTRADHLSGYGYPRGTTPGIDRLARRGTTFPVAHVPVPLTNPSHCSLFTGLEPDEHGVRNNGTALPDTIPTFVRDLAAAGYACGAFVSGIPLKHGLSGLAPGFTHYDDVFSPLERAHPMTTSLAVVRVANRVLPGDLIERRARDTCRAAIAWLEEASGPRFLWVHLFDPHSPYDAPAWRRDRYARDAAMVAEGRAANDWPIADYDAELRETDRWLDVLLRTFERETAGRGVVWLTADHGEGLEQHGELTHGTQLFEEDLRVPLITSRRDAREGGGGIVGGSVFTTALPELMRETDWTEVLGRTAPVRANTYPPEGRGRLTAVIGRLADGRWGKLWIDRVHGEERGYDLDTDPSERRPVTPDATFEPLRAFAGAGEPDAGHELDPETERRLRSLGYTH
ncbi:MAG: sulfatase, partial [Gemmatimonadetes bacterium]|nr:sulfatase [Gemmatimonadota bacterium]